MNWTGVFVSLGVFLACVAIGAVLNLLAKDKRQDQNSYAHSGNRKTPTRYFVVKPHLEYLSGGGTMDFRPGCFTAIPHELVSKFISLGVIVPEHDSNSIVDYFQDKTSAHINRERYFFLKPRSVRMADGTTLEFIEGRLYEPPPGIIADLVRDGVAIPEHEGGKIFDFVDYRRRELVQQLRESQQRFIAKQEESDRELKQVVTMKDSEYSTRLTAKQEEITRLSRQLQQKDEECQERVRANLHLLGTSEQTSEDPRVYLSIAERKFGPLTDTRVVFVASNNGGTEARNIQIRFSLPNAILTFDPVDVLASKDKADIIPAVSGERIPQKNDIYTALSMQPADANWSEITEFNFTLTYENHNRSRRFEASCTLLYRSLHRALKKQNILADDAKKILEIKHSDCKVVVA